MTSPDPAILPLSYDDLASDPPEGYQISTRVMLPLLIVARNGCRYYASLGTRRVSQGTSKLIKAPSIRHNWVLDAGTVYPLPRDIIEVAAQTLGSLNPSSLSFPDVLRLEREAGDTLPVCRDMDAMISANEEAEKETGECEIPNLRGTLYNYQARGVAWMSRTLSHTGGLILADEMGLGKTIQIISLFLLDPPASQAPALIICPTTLIENWVRELGAFAPSLSVLVHRGSSRAGLYRDLQKAQVVITTYDTLVNDSVMFCAIEWSFLVCDEAQAVKNPASRRRAVVARVPRRRAIPVTGTPVENSLLDLWSLMDLAIPGLLGSQSEFQTHWTDDIASARSLAAVTDPFVLKRQVADVAKDLPERIDVDVPLELGATLAREYERVRNDTIAKYPQAGALVATGQLQLFCAHPWLRTADTSAEGWEEDIEVETLPHIPLVTPKVERTLELLNEAFVRGKKVLIFASFNQCASLIQHAASGLPSAFWGMINGSTPQAERQPVIDRFSSHDGPAALILNPRAAGAGLNITAATVVIHFTQVWNPALEKQASARAHRRGQTSPVTIYRLFYVGTVEEVMLDRTHWKSELGNEAVPVTVRDVADLARALSISPGGGL